MTDDLKCEFIEKFLSFCEDKGFSLHEYIYSPILGIYQADELDSAEHKNLAKDFISYYNSIRIN